MCVLKWNATNALCLWNGVQLVKQVFEMNICLNAKSLVEVGKKIVTEKHERVDIVDEIPLEILRGD